MPNFNLKSKDISGDRFGSLIAIQRTGTKIYSNKKHAIWLFQCDCGKEIERTVKGLLRHKHTSCGCTKTKVITSVKDYTGQEFNRLTAVKQIDNKNYLFRCECGTEKRICIYDVLNGKTKSCGCLQKENFNSFQSERKVNPTKFIKDRTGEKYNFLTIVGLANNHDKKNQGLVWECVCVCGEVRHIPAGRLKSTKSCGCWRRSDQNLNKNKPKTTRIKKNCLFCGKEFLVTKFYKDKKFCSLSCSHKIRLSEERLCSYCNKTFRPGNKNQKFCTKECHSKSFKIKKSCEFCGTEIVVTNKNKNKRFCDLTCKGKFLSNKVKKVCLQCNKTFYKHFARSGAAKFCSKNCGYYFKAKIQQVDGEIRKKCTGCLELKHIKEFKKVKNKIGVNNLCNLCEPIYLKNYWTKNKDKRKANYHARRSRLMGAAGSYSAYQWREKLKYFGWCCYLCRTSLENKTVHHEHRIPISRGGTNWIANIAPACAKCNLEKSTKTEKEYRQLKANEVKDVQFNLNL